LEQGRDGHFGEAELAKLLERSRRASDSIRDLADIDPHLAHCAACREDFQELASLDRKLKTLKPSEPAPRHSDCPGGRVWHELAGGLLPPEQTLACIEHASRCDYCGPLLHAAVSELAGLHGEVTESERKHIATLESAQAEWQQKLAQRIAGTIPPNRSSPWWRTWMTDSRIAVAGASVLVVAGIVGVSSWVVVQGRQPAAAGQLLARAYTDKRTLELRIAGAAYAPLRVSRGPAASFTSRPPELLKAEALIAGQMASHPSDPAWLQAQAQADVLEGKYDAAVESLHRALELEPHSPSILTDLATAYFQRAQQEDRKDDFGAAYEYLSQALKYRPDDPVALFNRAIVGERQFLFHQALDDWDRYLQVDPNSAWAAEAREAAERVRTRLKEHETSQAAPLLSPVQIEAGANDPNLSAAVDERVEEYLSGAVRAWLPSAFPEKSAADPAARRALFFLADLTVQHHNDRWLSDLLHGSSAPNFPQAVAALAQAAKANDAGEYSTTRIQASQAERLFRASGNEAGILRAQFELIFAMHFELDSKVCRQLATDALRESEMHPYSWLQIQLGLEKSSCSFVMGDVGADERISSRAMDRARKSVYGSLYLRAVYFIADDQHSIGDQAGALSLTDQGLEQFWSGRLSDMQGYNLYAGMAIFADAANRPNFQVASYREALALIDRNQDLLLRAMAHNAMADAATEARLPRVAEQHYAEAARLFAAAPQSAASRSGALENLIHTAQLEARQGRFDDAIGSLTGIQDQVQAESNHFLPQMFYTTLGEVQLGRHRDAEAEQALRPALVLAEQNLDSLRSEGERTSWSKEAAPAYLALVEAQLVQGRSQDALDTYEWFLGAPQRVVGDRQVQSSLTQPLMPGGARLASRLPLLVKETVVTYAALPDGLAIWVYDDRGIHTSWIRRPSDELQELASRLRELASDPGSNPSALRRDARSLYGALIAPVEQYLSPGRTLVIEADGWLSGVPFEALLDSNDHYLIERAPIIHSLGQDSDARLHTDDSISSDSPALVVGSTASSQMQGLVPLPDVSREADAVARQFKFAQILKGGEATLASVKNDLPAATVLHFAGHSLSIADHAGLLLDNAGAPADTLSLLDADTLRHIKPQHLRLAVLSACSTASGSGGSSGFNSMTDTLLRAGVPHVVASRWAVDSVEASSLVNDFYRNALSGQPISEALRQTARTMLANPRTAHPYYWSAFSAFGRP
jgi:CHAT domain-containing protein/cytochrome c-type biogenesis protein CcmH/NrfG